MGVSFRYPSGFPPLRIGPPGSADMDPRGSTFAGGFGPPRKTFRYQVTSPENLAIRI